MYKIFFFVLISLLAVTGPILAKGYKSAHAIVIGNYGLVDTHQHPKQYVLLGLTKHGKLSTFGGLRNQGERDPQETAAREIEEETLGVLGNKKSIRRKLCGTEPMFGTTDGHLCYVMEATDYGKGIPGKFREIRWNKTSRLSHSQKEMIDIVAVRVEEVKHQVLYARKIQFKDNKGNLRPLRSSTAKALKAAIKKGKI